jgi:molybdate transport system substrate-binding protein
MTRTSHHSRMSSASLAALVLAVAIASSAGCERTSREGRLVVFAATSLRDAFTSMGEAFERAHPGVELTLNFAGTQELRTQLEHGAAVDVFASADQVHMDELVRAARATASRGVRAQRAGHGGVHGGGGQPSAASRICPSATRIVIGTPEVPIGRYTLQILDRASVDSRWGPTFARASRLAWSRAS